MKITKKVNGDEVVLAIEGRLDTSTAPELESALGEIAPTTKKLTLDFENLEYVSSAGLRVLLTAQKTMNAHNGKMVVKKANEVVRDVFDVTGFSSFIALE